MYAACSSLKDLNLSDLSQYGRIEPVPLPNAEASSPLPPLSHQKKERKRKKEGEGGMLKKMSKDDSCTAGWDDKGPK